MAGSTSGNHVPASEAVQVLVSSLADESQLVREASASSIKDIALLNPILVLECSSNASRSGRRRFVKMAGAFQVMSVAVSAINSSEVDSAFMLKLANVATAEIVSSKDDAVFDFGCDTCQTDNSVWKLLEHISKIVFDEVLAASGKDITTKDIYRLRGGWPMQDAFYAFAQHATLSFIFLDHMISTIKKTPTQTSNLERVDSGRNVDGQIENELLQAAILALTAFFRGGGKVGKKAVEQSYSYVLAELIIQLGSCHCLASAGQRDPLQALLTAFHAFCECVGDLEMGKVSREGEHNENEKWIDLIGDLADSISIKRPKEVEYIASILSKSLNRDHKYQREAAAAALSEFIPYSGSFDSVLDQMVEALCRHVSDVLPTVRRLSLRGLVQVLGVILASLDDTEESVQLTAVSCLLKILESAPNEAVEPILLNLYKTSYSADMHECKDEGRRILCIWILEAFLEQVHGSIPRLVLHLHDDDRGVRQACRDTLKRVAPLFEGEDLAVLFSLQSINSDERSDYEDFLRNFSKQVPQLVPSRMDTFMSSVVQAFDAPWPIIQANAIYLACSVLSLSDDHRILSIYYAQVCGMLVTKINRSSDAIVRATCSSALGLLLKTNALPSWREVRLDRTESVRKGHTSESPRKKS